MSGPTTTRPARRLPLGLLGMLILIGAVELAISARRLDFTTIWADDWRSAARAASRQAKGRDVLCFGDSLVKFGVLPKVIEARAGLRSYNLAVNAGTVPASSFLLRRALEAGARPKAIVVDFFALMQPDVPRKSIRLYPDLATPGECLGLAIRAGDSDFFHAVLVGKLLPSYKCRFEIRESVKAALQGRRASPWPGESWVWAAWRSNDGAQPMPGSPARPPAHPVLVSDVSPAQWACDPINAAYVEEFLALAESRQIPVFWLLPPISPEVQALRDLRRTDEAYDRFARSTVEHHPGVVVLDARDAGYESSAFVDPLHLARRGAEVLSGDLAERLADHLNGRARASRWVALPAFRGRPARGVARVFP